MEVVDVILSLSESLGAPMICVGIVAYMLKREQDLHAEESRKYATILERISGTLGGNTDALSDVASALRDLLTHIGGVPHE